MLVAITSLTFAEFEPIPVKSAAGSEASKPWHWPPCISLWLVNQISMVLLIKTCCHVNVLPKLWNTLEITFRFYYEVSPLSGKLINGNWSTTIFFGENAGWKVLLQAVRIIVPVHVDLKWNELLMHLVISFHKEKVFWVNKEVLKQVL